MSTNGFVDELGSRSDRETRMVTRYGGGPINLVSSKPPSFSGNKTDVVYLISSTIRDVYGGILKLRSRNPILKVLKVISKYFVVRE